MRQEYSYGAVVYQICQGRVFYLIEHMTLGHISLPKGHIEKGETPAQCARREIKEETNLEVELDQSFSHTIAYSPRPEVMKKVTFFLAEAKTLDIIAQPEEVSFTQWLPYEEAYLLLTHESDKETLALANLALLKKYDSDF